MTGESFSDPFAPPEVKDSDWVDAVRGLPLGWTRSKPVQPMLDALDAVDDVAKKARFADLEAAAAARDKKTYLHLANAPLRPPPPGEVDKKGISVARKLNGDTFWSSLKARLGK